MSEFHPRVIKICEIKEHPYADLLEIIEVDGGYPCCVTKGKHHVGDTVVYIPVGSMVDSSNPLFSFLDKNDKGGFIRIKALKLREIFSMGLIIDNVGNWPVDYEPIVELDIRKYEPPQEVNNNDDDVISNIEVFPYYDLEALRKYHHLFSIGENIAVTEKIHGTNSTFGYVDGYDDLVLKSHNKYKKFNPESRSFWNNIAREYHLSEILKDFKDIAICGEIYGGKLQKGFNYNLVNQKLVIFDTFDCKTNTWHGYKKTTEIVSALNKNKHGIIFDQVPLLSLSTWKDLETLKPYAEGKSILGDHIREGIVVESLDRLFNNRGIRMKFKLHGEGYLLSKHAIV